VEAAMPDYATLRVLWWALLGFLLIGFAILDGFDFGVAALLKLLGRNATERKVLLEGIESNWEGNQVWFIVAGASTFAAWPMLYAVSFSGMYFAIALVLLALILRPVGFKFRDKITDPRWVSLWDWVLVVSGVTVMFVSGVAFGNLFLGLPFAFDEDLRMRWEGGLFDLLHPFALLTGLVATAMLLAHGACFAALKADHAIAVRAVAIARWTTLAFAALYVLAGVWLAYGIPGYAITGPAVTEGVSNPLYKQVAHGSSSAVTSSINCSVPRLVEASHSVRLECGSRLDGSRNGNSAKPAEAIVPPTIRLLATKPATLRRPTSACTPTAEASASSGAAQNHGYRM
jgi:cytochrome d ubiquinol oxidase subunit II